MNYFCGGRKTREPGEKPSKSNWDQPIRAHIGAQDRTRVAVVGSADYDHCAILTPHPPWNVDSCWYKGVNSCTSLLLASIRYHLVQTCHGFLHEGKFGYTTILHAFLPNWCQNICPILPSTFNHISVLVYGNSSCTSVTATCKNPPCNREGG